MSQQAILLADLGLGDSGKGSIIDYLSRETGAPTVIRYNGGPQAAHNVVSIDGRQHTFAQFGSGTLVAGVRTLLSRFMLINPLNMLKEERHLRALGITDALQRMQIDRRALVITPFQRAINRLRELARAELRHGSCGEGIGECMADYLTASDQSLHIGDLQDSVRLRQKLRLQRANKRMQLAELRGWLPDHPLARQEMALFTDEGSIEDCAEVYQYFARQVEMLDESGVSALLAQPGTLLFEGAQGVLLDENHGFTPYTTWSTTTFANAHTILREHNYTGEISTLGVIRTYATRHGAGPFPSEARELNDLLPERHNTWNNWQRAFRSGYFDLLTARYALDLLGQVDHLALTHLDCLQTLPVWKLCQAYLYQGQPADLAGYFEYDGQRISKIHAAASVDLERQEQLTRRLLRCSPEYLTLPGHDPASYLALLEEQLHVPILLTSCGPTAADKQLRRVHPGGRH
ncbi:MAG TPA: adenylosuccinate synthetase [Ktedonobacteraceae bacterium]|jgi:adenylosuccinate synthase